MNVFAQRALLAAAVLLAGCVGFGAWTASDSIQDPPLINGLRAIAKFQSASCTMCTTGSTAQYAFFSPKADHPYFPRDAGEPAAALVRKDHGLQWSPADSLSGDKQDVIAPIRIIVPSLEPLLVITLPWAYKSAITNYAVAYEMNRFTDVRCPGICYFSATRARGLRNLIEVRGSLPKETTAATISSARSRQALTMPASAGQSSTVTMDGYLIRLTRQDDGSVLVGVAGK
ncbi:MAG: hypothetical protein V4484_06810 [Pseudomonadota bacterium]